MRRPIIAGNWKMFKTLAETTGIFRRSDSGDSRCRALRNRRCASIHGTGCRRRRSRWHAGFDCSSGCFLGSAGRVHR